LGHNHHIPRVDAADEGITVSACAQKNGIASNEGFIGGKNAAQIGPGSIKTARVRHAARGRRVGVLIGGAGNQAVQKQGGAEEAYFFHEIGFCRAAKSTGLFRERARSLIAAFGKQCPGPQVFKRFLSFFAASISRFCCTLNCTMVLTRSSGKGCPMGNCTEPLALLNRESSS